MVLMEEEVARERRRAEMLEAELQDASEQIVARAAAEEELESARAEMKQLRGENAALRAQLAAFTARDAQQDAIEELDRQAKFAEISDLVKGIAREASANDGLLALLRH